MLEKFAFHPSDTEDIRLKKMASVIIAGACCVAGVFWTLMYYLIYGLNLTTALPALFVLIVGICIVIAHFTKNHLWSTYGLIICIIYITAAIQWNIGGMYDSGFVMAWSIIGPITALMFFSQRQAIFWFALFLLNIVVTAVFDSYFSLNLIPVSHTITQLYFVMNLGISGLVVFVFTSYFVSSIQRERSRADSLLLNILPSSIAQRLKKHETTIAERYAKVSVLFADIVGFTTYASTANPEELILKLDNIFNRFDSLARHYGLEKIKTIGDAYMVAGGIPLPDEKHCMKIGMIAKDMLREVEKLNETDNHKFSIRIGIHCGPVVAGVIGTSKFAYDLWGDTVNVASRMEMSGEAGRIQVTDEYYNLTKSVFEFESRGLIDVKGKGQLHTWFLVK